MDEEQIRKKAREKMQGFCRVCKVCDGQKCISGVPGMGGAGSGGTFRANYSALADLKIIMRTLHEVAEIETTVDFLGLKLALPVIIAPVAGSSFNMGLSVSEEEYVRGVVEGSLAAGTIASTGDGLKRGLFETGLEAIKKVRGKGIPFIKPWAGEKLFNKIRLAEEAGALAIGMDVDGVYLINNVIPGKAEIKTPEKISQIVKSTELPVIIKGIMTADEAEICCEAGASAIVVSNHGGRVLDGVPGTAEVLPAIVEKLKGKVTVLVDGGVRSGVDILKMLALGADAVLVGRPAVIASCGGGAEGVAFMLNQYRQQLEQALALTGFPAVKALSRDVFYAG